MLTEILSVTASALYLSVSAAGAVQDPDLDKVLEGKVVKGEAVASGYRRDRDWDRDRDYRDDRYGRETTITCRSRGGYDRCETRGRIESLRFISSRSSGRCRIGRDWGVEPRAVWVDNGCRATFVVETYREGRDYSRRDRDDDYRRDRYGETKSLYCRSPSYDRYTCRIDERFDNVRLVDRRSKAQCRYDRDWGVSRNGIWVQNGCRAVFTYEGYGYGRRRSYGG
ncbi:MAG: DUF3011 domain-containing protein [Pseudomonadota bacterium]